MSEQNPVSFHSLVLPKPRGLVRSKTSQMRKNEDQRYRWGSRWRKGVTFQPVKWCRLTITLHSPPTLQTLHDLIWGVDELLEEMEEDKNLLQEELGSLCQGCSGRYLVLLLKFASGQFSHPQEYLLSPKFTTWTSTQSSSLSARSR